MHSLGTRSSAAEVLIELDRSARVPLHVQLEQALRDLIRSGTLSAGATLPSTRILASDLGVSRRLVVDAYQQLVAEGYLTSAPRSATRVAAADRLTGPRTRPPDPVTPRYDLRPSAPDLQAFPRAEWQKAMRHALRSAPDSVLGYPDPQGAPALRAALAAYLRRVRGVATDPDRIVICAGFTQALSLLTSTLSIKQAARIAHEDPGLHDQDAIITTAGGTNLPVPVDEHGLDPSTLTAIRADAVVVTPAHQFPTGVTLSPARRGALLDWARHGGLIIEDDYDAEFRYDHAPVAAMQGLAPADVAYAGSVSKTLTPALRLGWLALPDHLAGAVADQRRLHDAGAPTLQQLALARCSTPAPMTATSAACAATTAPDATP